MSIFTVVGARPNFIKIDPKLKQTIIHTGQHYDYRMNQIFFKERKIPKPTHNLNCKGHEVGKMIDRLRKLYAKEKPDLVVVFGDTHSSFAGALAAAYLRISVAHIEAGLRSFRMDMPEEINRILIDRIATIKLCPNASAAMNLLKEGIKDNIHIVGDPEFDAMNDFLPLKQQKNHKKYCLLTIHRNFNADNKENLSAIMEAVQESGETIYFPCHPRTEKALQNHRIKIPKNVKKYKPVGYRKFLQLVIGAKKVITDSGGVQREAFWLGTPVIILRTETEWLEIPSSGAGVLVGTNREEIVRAIKDFKGKQIPPPIYGANKKIRDILYRHV